MDLRTVRQAWFPRSPEVVDPWWSSNVAWAEAPGNALLGTAATGLPRDSVATVSQIVVADRRYPTQWGGRVPAAKLALVLGGIAVVPGR
ncbi:hypothetical protein KGQ64_10305 [bacterium]|nr:hypothetical protein [bacterium]